MKSNTNHSSNIQALHENPKVLIPTSERYRLISLFAFLTGLSFFLGLEFANSIYNPIDITKTSFDQGLTLGIIVGTAQWVIIRKYLFDKKWIIVTAVGFGISMFLGSWLTFNSVTGTSGSRFVVIWLGFASQWLVLRRYVRRSWIWLVLSLLVALLIVILWAILIPSPPINEINPIDRIQLMIIKNGIKLMIIKLSQSLIIGVTFALGLCIFDRKR